MSDDIHAAPAPSAAPGLDLAGVERLLDVFRSAFAESLREWAGEAEVAKSDAAWGALLAALRSRADGGVPSESEQPHPSLTADFINAMPDGTRDTSTYEDIESALDRADAACCAPDGRWLTLPERVAALAARTGEAK